MHAHHVTAKDKETKRIVILIHNGVARVINDLKVEDFPFVHTSIGRVFTEDVVSSYYKILEQFKSVYADTPSRRLTAFDKALCLAMALEKQPVITVSGYKGKKPVITVSGYKGKKPVRLTDMKAKAIANIVVDFLHDSSYSVKGSLVEGTLDLNVFDDGHKKEFKQLKTLLADEFKS